MEKTNALEVLHNMEESLADLLHGYMSDPDLKLIRRTLRNLYLIQEYVVSTK